VIEAPVSEKPRSAASRRDVASPAVHHTGSVDAILARLDADAARGLEPADARERLEKHGPNELPSAPPPSALKQILAQFANPIVLTLLVAAVIATINGARARNRTRRSWHDSATPSRSASSSCSTRCSASIRSGAPSRLSTR
jgi:magnesium-transporting ATPase (P-type)